MIAANCQICGDFAVDFETSGISHAYGEDALRGSEFLFFKGHALFVPVAPLCIDYLMIAPLKHTHTPLSFTSDIEFESLVSSTLRILEKKHGASWSFEHTSMSREGPSCVEHSHFHLLPGYPPTSLFKFVSEPDETAPDAVVRTLAGSVALRTPSRQKQFIRRHIAADLNIGPGWDWRIYRHDAEFFGTTESFARLRTMILRELNELHVKP